MNAKRKERRLPISIELQPEMARRLDRLASLSGRTKAFHLHELIMHGIDDVEDYYLAAKVAEDIRSGREETSTLEDVEARLGLAD